MMCRDPRALHLPPTAGALAAAAVLLLALGAPARAAAPRCDALAAAPRAPADPATRWGDAIWGAVSSAAARLGPAIAPPALAWLDRPDVGAWYCRPQDTVYVTQSLATYAWLGRASDGADFLGFVLAHELAHRRFDAADTSAALAPACADVDAPREARADRRAAFLLALARDPTTHRAYSPFELARRDSLAAFFSAELGWTDACPALAARADAVTAAVAHMTRLGRLYDVALALALRPSAHDDAAVAALTALTAALDPSGDRWDAVPELALTLALVHLDRAARAGWCPDELAAAPLTPSPCALRCVPIVPGHASLAPTDAFGQRAPAPYDRQAELAAADGLLAQAARRGASAPQLAGLRACAAYLAVDPARARRALARVDTASAAAPGAAILRARLRDLRALVALQELLLELPGPIGTPAWRDALRERAQSPALAGDSDAARALGAWLDDPPPTPPLPPAPAELAPAADAWVTLGTCEPLDDRPLGGGWTVATNDGCAEVRREGAVVTRLREARPTGLSATVTAWAAHCTFTLAGTADDGADVLRADCPAWDGAGQSWLLFVRDDAWTRAVRVEERAP